MRPLFSLKGLKRGIAPEQFPIKFLESHNLRPHHYLLDFGVSRAKRSLSIIRYLNEGRFFGVDVRPTELLEAKKRIKKAGLEHKNASLIDSSKSVDITKLPKFDLVWSIEVFVHLDDDKLLEALEFIHSILTPDGAAFINLDIRKHRRKKFGEWLEFPKYTSSLEFYKEVCAECNLSLVDLGVVKDLSYKFRRPKNEKEANEIRRFQRMRVVKITKAIIPPA